MKKKKNKTYLQTLGAEGGQFGTTLKALTDESEIKPIKAKVDMSMDDVVEIQEKVKKLKKKNKDFEKRMYGK